MSHGQNSLPEEYMGPIQELLGSTEASIAAERGRFSPRAPQPKPPKIVCICIHIHIYKGK